MGASSLNHIEHAISSVSNSCLWRTALRDLSGEPVIERLLVHHARGRTPTPVPTGTTDNHVLGFRSHVTDVAVFPAARGTLGAHHAQKWREKVSDHERRFSRSEDVFGLSWQVAKPPGKTS